MQGRVWAGWLLVCAMVAGCECGPSLQEARTVGSFRSPTPRGQEGRQGLLYLGAWPVGMAATGRIQLANEGNRPFTVRALRAVRGQLDGALRLDVQVPFDVGAGASVQLEARFTGLPAPAEAEVVVAFETEGEAQVDVGPLTLTLRAATVLPTCEVASPVDFGFVRVGGRGQRSFTLRNPFASLFRTTFQRADFEGFEAPEGAVDVPPEGEVEVPLAFRPAEARAYEGTLTGTPGWRCPPRAVQLKGVGTTNDVEWLPKEVDCGWVPPGLRVQRTVTFFNATAQPQTVTLAQPVSPEVALAVGTPAVLALAGGAQQTVALECAPQSFGVRRTEVGVETSGVPARGVVPVVVKGGGPWLEAPRVVDFGVVAFIADAGFVTRQQVPVRNTGFSPPRDVTAHLFFSLAPQDGGIFGVGDYGNYIASEGLPGDSGVLVSLEARPASPGQYESDFLLTSNALNSPRQTLTARARVVQVRPCSYTVSPGFIDFGNFEGGEVRDAIVTLTNTGTHPEASCVFSRPRLELADAQFSFEGFTSLLLGPGESHAVRVRFTARPFEEQDLFSAQLVFDVSSPASPTGRVLLRAFGGQPCVAVSPFLDFGAVPLGCAKTIDIRYSKACMYEFQRPSHFASAPFAASSIVIRSYQADGGRTVADAGLFSFVTPCLLGGVVSADCTESSLTFRPVDAGVVTSVLALTAHPNTNASVCDVGEPTTFYYPVRGEGVGRERVALEYVVSPSDVDLLLCSAADAGSVTTSLLGQLVDAGVSFRLGVPFNWQRRYVNLRAFAGDPDGRCVIRDYLVQATRADRDQGTLLRSVDGGLFASTASDSWRDWWDEMASTAPDGFECVESSLRALGPRLASSNAGFRRPNVPLVILNVDQEQYSTSTDENPILGAAWPAELHAARFAPLVGGLSQLQVNLLFPFCPQRDEFDFRRFHQFVALSTGGIAETNCQGWDHMGRLLTESVLGLRRRIPVKVAPDMSTLRVTLDGADVQGVSFNEVGSFLLLPSTPPVGARVGVTYLPRCD